MVKSTPDYEPDYATIVRENAVWFPIFYPRSTNIECKEHVYILVRTQSPSFH